MMSWTMGQIDHSPPAPATIEAKAEPLPPTSTPTLIKAAQELAPVAPRPGPAAAPDPPQEPSSQVRSVRSQVQSVRRNLGAPWS
jgi:hypothetical protein